MNNQPDPLDPVGIAYASAIDLGHMIAKGPLTSEALTRMYLDRLTKYGPQLCAVVNLMPDAAIAQARQMDIEISRGKRRSVLHGVPYGIKDLFSAKGAPTTWGSPIFADRVIDEDAVVVQKLFDAGCPLLGKLAMIEFAGGGGYRFATASLTGAARTPWDLDHWAGGSSSGSGAAVAAGLVGFAIGTETWGSILCPSSYCGVTGLRPTSGRVSRAGAMTLSWTMDKVGPLARTALDCGTVLEIISGPDGGDDPGLRPGTESQYYLPYRLPKLQGMRIGVVRPDYGTPASVLTAAGSAFHDSLIILKKLGAEVVDVQLPDLPTDEAANTIVAAEGSAAFEDVIRDPVTWRKIVDPEMRGSLAANLETPSVDYLRALRIRNLAQQSLPQVFARIELLVAPTYLQVAPPITANLDDYFSVGSDNRLSGLGNLLGLPAASVPMGVGEAGLPLGIQFVGAPLQENNVLAAANAFQLSTEWSGRKPPLFL